jgi:ribosomal protein S18 acetylase RimI-like enzyme
MPAETPAPAPSGPAPHILDHPVRASLLGAHAHLAEAVGDVRRYRPDVTIFGALPSTPDDRAWREAAELVGPGGWLVTAGESFGPGPGWEQTMELPGVQLVDEGCAAAPEREAVPLGPDDLPDILDLIDHARPGPFLPGTLEMGAYLGIRRGGRLVAMAGERLRPPGWTEISAVCTHSDFRGQGLGTRLVHAVVLGIRERGDTAFLHAAAENVNAIRLYEALGFRLRRKVTFSRYALSADSL